MQGSKQFMWKGYHLSVEDITKAQVCWGLYCFNVKNLQQSFKTSRMQLVRISVFQSWNWEESTFDVFD